MVLKMFRCGRLFRLSSILILRRCIQYEAYLPAQPSSPLQGSRFPSENGYFQRPQGSCPSPCKGPQGSVCLIELNWVTNSRMIAQCENGSYKWGERIFRPTPFFIGNTLKILFRPDGGAFPALLRFVSLEIHKVFLRLPTSLCRKIPRPRFRKFFLRVFLCIFVSYFLGEIL